MTMATLARTSPMRSPATCAPTSLGKVVVGETGWDLTRPGEKGDTVQASDLAFVRADRLPPPPPRKGKTYRPIAPDLVVEVASPSQFGREDLDDKAHRWIDRGVRLVWVVWPDRKTVERLGAGRCQTALTRRRQCHTRLRLAPVRHLGVMTVPDQQHPLIRPEMMPDYRLRTAILIERTQQHVVVAAGQPLDHARQVQLPQLARPTVQVAR